MAISVLRGGETAYAWSGEGWAVRLDHADHAMLIKFDMWRVECLQGPSLI